MSQLCGVSKCERAARAPCECCKQTLCLQHLYQHNRSIVSQLNPLAEEIKILGDRINAFNLEEKTSDCREKLENWRLDCHKKIDDIFDQKCQELDLLLAKKTEHEREKILYVQTKLDQLIHHDEASRQDIDALTSTIRRLEKEMNRIEQARFQVNIGPLVIDDSIIRFKVLLEHVFDSSAFSSVYKTIIRSDASSRAMASSGELLLIHQAPHLRFLNSEFSIAKQIKWPHDFIVDMCWSLTLNKFIVITKKDVFLVDEHTKSIETVQVMEEQNWFSVSCCKDDLFLSTGEWGSSIVEVSLSPSVTVVKQWKSPKTCKMNEHIDCIRHHNGTFAVMISNNEEKSTRMELRSGKTMDRLWFLFLDVVQNEDIPFRCCSLVASGWLVADHNGGRLLHISPEGEMQETIIYKKNPYRITLFTADTLAVATKLGVNLHKKTT